MRLSEVLRCGYTHGISSLGKNKKRGRVSLEDLREVESLQARTHPTSSDLIAAHQHQHQHQHQQQKQTPDESLDLAEAACRSTCALQLTPAPSTAAESGSPSSEDCSTQQEDGSCGISSCTGSLPDCLQITHDAPSPAEVNPQLCLAHPTLLQQLQQQEQQQPADHMHHLQQQAHTPGPHHLPQQAVLAGKLDMQDAQDMHEKHAGQQLRRSEGSNDGDSDSSSELEQDEELELELGLDSSEATSEFEDAYSDYGTTEEEEENNSIPPADLEAILAENAKLWWRQQQQQQQHAKSLQVEHQVQAQSRAQEQQQQQ